MGSNEELMQKISEISAMIAILLTWIPFLFFLFMPAYRGNEITLVGTVQKTATLVEMNGFWVIWLLLIPISLSCMATVGVIMTRLSRRRRLIMMWMGTSLLFSFCLIGLGSIGLFYLPSLLMLVLAVGIQTSPQRGGVGVESASSPL